MSEQLRDLRAALDKSSAEVADLKARLKAIRDVTRFHEHGDGLLEHHERVIKYATNIRRKNWRLP